MSKYISLNLDRDRVRFTPDGKIVVVDAIRALLGEHHPETIWGRLKKKLPQLRDHCEEYDFEGSVNHQVADSDGWDVIEGALFDYILDREAAWRNCPDEEECPA